MTGVNNTNKPILGGGLHCFNATVCFILPELNSLMENNLVSKSKLVEKGKQNNQVEWEKNNADVTLCHEEEEKIMSQSDKLHKILPQSLVLKSIT